MGSKRHVFLKKQKASLSKNTQPIGLGGLSLWQSLLNPMPLIFMVLFISLNLSFPIFEVVIGSPRPVVGIQGNIACRMTAIQRVPEYMFLCVIFPDSDD